MKKFAPKVKVGVPRWENLSPEQQSFTQALYARLDVEGIERARSFSPMNISERTEKLKRCQGVIVLGFATWSAERISPRKKGDEAVFVSDFVQIYTTLALAQRCPLLVFVEKSVTLRGVLRPHFVPKPLKLPKSFGSDCLSDGVIGHHFNLWLESVKSRKQLFFGYSKSAIAIAEKIRVFLQRIGISVLDWQTDFQLTDAIYSQMKSAAAQTVCAVFLLTREEGTLDSGLQAPADNLIFEVGYFAAVHGKENTVIILEDGVSIPDHLRGYIFIPLSSRDQVRPVQEELRRCLSERLA